MAYQFNRVRPSGDYVLFRYGSVYVVFNFLLYQNGLPIGQYTRSGYGSGGAYVWQRKIKKTQTIQRWVGGKKYSFSGDEYKFYDPTLDEKLGGDVQTLGG